MNRIYQRYLDDETFRASILEAAKQERAKAVGRLFAGVFHLPKNKQRRHAARSHFARQG